MPDLTIARLYADHLPAVPTVMKLLKQETDPRRVAEFATAVEAARTIDAKNSERRNYWGELGIWSKRRLAELIQKGQDQGTIAKRGGDRKSKLADLTLNLKEVLGSRTDEEAKWASHRAKKLAAIPEKAIRQYVAAETERSGEVSQAGLIRYVGADGNIKAHQNQGVVEWYTPAEYIEAARKVMGSIELDPATSPFAQKVVQATRFFTRKDDGLSKSWKGTVFLNPPFKMPEVEQFIEKLCAHVVARDVSQAVLLTNNNTDTGWWHLAGETASIICVTRGRIKWYSATDPTCSPTNGQTFFYFGRRISSFREVFGHFGMIWVK